MKNFHFLLGLALLILWTSPLMAETIPWENMHNHFMVDMPHGDKGTLDFDQDGVMTIMPYTTNRDYVHICWGDWKYEAATQVMTIKKAKRCEFMNGEYHVVRARGGFSLKNGKKNLPLRYVQSKR